MDTKKLQARDFITIGIFTALLWVVQMVIMYMLSFALYCCRLSPQPETCLDQDERIMNIPFRLQKTVPADSQTRQCNPVRFYRKALLTPPIRLPSPSLLLAFGALYSGVS